MLKKEIRKELRKKATPAERVLWSCLRGNQLRGRKFRRQHSIGPYVVDFYCHEERIVIELDGHHHYSGPGSEYDEVREQFMRTMGIQVLRFENKMVFEQPQRVLEHIEDHFVL